MNADYIPYTLLVVAPKGKTGTDGVLVFLEPRGTERKVPYNLSLLGKIPLRRAVRDFNLPPRGMGLFLMIISLVLSNPTFYGQGKTLVEIVLTEGYHRYQRIKIRNTPMENTEKQFRKKADSLFEMTYEQSLATLLIMATHFIESMICREVFDSIYREIDRIIAEYQTAAPGELPSP